MPVPVHANEIALTQGRRPRVPPRLSPWRRVRRITAIALGLCLVPTAISYLAAVTATSNSTFTINSFEWLRNNGAAGLAVEAEDLYYSLNAPSTGGPGLKKLPLTHERGRA